MITFCRRTFGVYFLGIWELADLSTVPRFWLSLPLIPDVDQANELKWLTTPAANGRHLHPSALPAATALPLGSPELYRRQRRQRWRRLFNLYSICCRFAACCSAAASTVIIYPFPGPYFSPFSVVLTHSVNITQTTLRFKVNVAAPRNEKLIESPFI